MVDGGHNPYHFVPFHSATGKSAMINFIYKIWAPPEYLRADLKLKNLIYRHRTKNTRYCIIEESNEAPYTRKMI